MEPITEHATNKKAEILTRFLGYCEPHQNMPLGFLEVDEDVYDGPANPSHVAGLLADEFSAGGLEETGLVVMSEDGALSLAPALIGHDPFIALRDAGTNKPYDLLTQAGCLSGALPVLEILRDARTQHLLLPQECQYIFVVYEISAVVMLRACGLPATLTTGLDNWTLEQAEMVCKTFRIEYCGHEEIASPSYPAHHTLGMQMQVPLEMQIQHALEKQIQDPLKSHMQNPLESGEESLEDPTLKLLPQLTFVGWMPLELSGAMPCQLPPIVDHLRQFSQFLDLDLDAIGLWQVSEEMIEGLRFFAKHQNAQYFLKMLLEDTADVTTTIFDIGDDQSWGLAPLDFPAAIAHFQQLRRDSEWKLDSTQEQNEAWRDAMELLNRQLIQPLREEAFAISDPIQRTRLTLIAELSHIFHSQAITLEDRMVRREKISERQLDQLLATADRLKALTRTSECQHRRTTIIHPKILSSSTSPPLPPSESQKAN